MKPPFVVLAVLVVFVIGAYLYGRYSEHFRGEYEGYYLNGSLEPLDYPLKPDLDGLETLYPYSLNHFSTNCCPGPVHSTEGCACLSSRQRSLWKTRGGNATLGG